MWLRRQALERRVPLNMWARTFWPHWAHLLYRTMFGNCWSALDANVRGRRNSSAVPNYTQASMGFRLVHDGAKTCETSD
jgi:hypothetical protein